jgi:hypothetical protein
MAPENSAISFQSIDKARTQNPEEAWRQEDRVTWLPLQMCLRFNSRVSLIYEVVSKLFRTGAAIYTAVVLARSTGRW